MDISFTCDKCGKKLIIDDATAGITIDCPECGKAVYEPSSVPPAAIEGATGASDSGGFQLYNPLIRRARHSGNPPASQAGEVGSIPIARSTFPKQNANSCFWCDNSVTDLTVYISASSGCQRFTLI
jgi:phage FluMu protein Com